LVLKFVVESKSSFGFRVDGGRWSFSWTQLRSHCQFRRV